VAREVLGIDELVELDARARSGAIESAMTDSRSTPPMLISRSSPRAAKICWLMSS
jgi:hypothetical protein